MWIQDNYLFAQLSCSGGFALELDTIVIGTTIKSLLLLMTHFEVWRDTLPNISFIIIVQILMEWTCNLGIFIIILQSFMYM